MLSKRGDTGAESSQVKDGSSTVAAGTGESKRRSAIEYTILGISWKRGPRTTYALMKELSSSTSTYYRSRAGTAYPVVERLIAAGLLAYQDTAGHRGERMVTITEDGISALVEWLTPPVDFEEVAHTVDFLRLRTFYLGAVEAGEREKFFDEAISSLESQLTNLELAIASYQEIGDTFSELAVSGVVFETKARIQWLNHIRKAAMEAPVGRPPQRPK